MSKITITSGMANRLLRSSKVKISCKSCGLDIPKYKGRYPVKCPTCHEVLAYEVDNTEYLTQLGEDFYSQRVFIAQEHGFQNKTSVLNDLRRQHSYPFLESLASSHLLENLYYVSFPLPIVNSSEKPSSGLLLECLAKPKNIDLSERAIRYLSKYPKEWISEREISDITKKGKGLILSNPKWLQESLVRSKEISPNRQLEILAESYLFCRSHLSHEESLKYAQITLEEELSWITRNILTEDFWQHSGKVPSSIVRGREYMDGRSMVGGFRFQSGGKEKDAAKRRALSKINRNRGLASRIRTTRQMLQRRQALKKACQWHKHNPQSPRMHKSLGQLLHRSDGRAKSVGKRLQKNESCLRLFSDGSKYFQHPIHNFVITEDSVTLHQDKRIFPPGITEGVEYPHGAIYTRISQGEIVEVVISAFDSLLTEDQVERIVLSAAGDTPLNESPILRVYNDSPSYSQLEEEIFLYENFSGKRIVKLTENCSVWESPDTEKNRIHQEFSLKKTQIVERYKDKLKRSKDFSTAESEKVKIEEEYTRDFRRIIETKQVELDKLSGRVNESALARESVFYNSKVEIGDYPTTQVLLRDVEAFGEPSESSPVGKIPMGSTVVIGNVYKEGQEVTHACKNGYNFVELFVVGKNSSDNILPLDLLTKDPYFSKWFKGSPVWRCYSKTEDSLNSLRLTENLEESFLTTAALVTSWVMGISATLTMVGQLHSWWKNRSFINASLGKVGLRFLEEYVEGEVVVGGFDNPKKIRSLAKTLMDSLPSSFAIFKFLNGLPMTLSAAQSQEKKIRANAKRKRTNLKNRKDQLQNDGSIEIQNARSDQDKRFAKAELRIKLEKLDSELNEINDQEEKSIEEVNLTDAKVTHDTLNSMVFLNDFVKELPGEIIAFLEEKSKTSSIQSEFITELSKRGSGKISFATQGLSLIMLEQPTFASKLFFHGPASQLKFSMTALLFAWKYSGGLVLRKVPEWYKVVMLWYEEYREKRKEILIVEGGGATEAVKSQEKNRKSFMSWFPSLLQRLSSLADFVKYPIVWAFTDKKKFMEQGGEVVIGTALLVVQKSKHRALVLRKGDSFTVSKVTNDKTLFGKTVPDDIVVLRVTKGASVGKAYAFQSEVMNAIFHSQTFRGEVSKAEDLVSRNHQEVKKETDKLLSKKIRVKEVPLVVYMDGKHGIPLKRGDMFQVVSYSGTSLLNKDTGLPIYVVNVLKGNAKGNALATGRDIIKTKGQILESSKKPKITLYEVHKKYKELLV